MADTGRSGYYPSPSPVLSWSPVLSLKRMWENAGALDRLDLRFHWGGFSFRVLRFHLTSFAPGKTIPFHQHSEYELHFIPGGRGKVSFGGSEYALREGMFYVTGPGVSHCQEAHAAVPMEELCLHVDIQRGGHRPPEGQPDWEAEEAEACIAALDRLPLKPALDGMESLHWFSVALQALLERRAGMMTVIRHAVIQLLLLAVRGHEAAAETGAPRWLPARDMNRYRFELATQFIQDNITSRLSLEEVADKLQISGRQLQRIFLEQGGERFSEHVDRLRIARIGEALTSSNEPVERIAERFGFSSGNYLHTAFRKRTGLTPAQYRLRHRSPAPDGER